jgi:hypothetical protein
MTCAFSFLSLIILLLPIFNLVAAVPTPTTAKSSSDSRIPAILVTDKTVSEEDPKATVIPEWNPLPNNMNAPRDVSNPPNPVNSFDINRAVSPENRDRFAKLVNGIDVTTHTLSLYREKFYKGGSQFWDQSMF